jgi:hypothetical protein
VRCSATAARRKEAETRLSDQRTYVYACVRACVDISDEMWAGASLMAVGVVSLLPSREVCLWWWMALSIEFSFFFLAECSQCGVQRNA